ncbi:MAG: hypothetical protein V9F01_03695 [Chitinophagaceae bacterium]
MLQAITNTPTRKGYVINTRPFELGHHWCTEQQCKTQPLRCMLSMCFINGKMVNGYINHFRATTDPGNYWLKTFMNRNGTAILKPGQYKHSHRIGVHRGKYQALVQQNPVTVLRDDNANDQCLILITAENRRPAFLVSIFTGHR